MTDNQIGKFCRLYVLRDRGGRESISDGNFGETVGQEAIYSRCLFQEAGGRDMDSEAKMSLSDLGSQLPDLMSFARPVGVSDFINEAVMDF